MTRPLSLFVPSMRGGGAEHVATLVANGIADRGIPVDLIIGDARGPSLSKIQPAVRIVDLKSPRLGASIPKLASYLRHNRPSALIPFMEHTAVVSDIALRIARADTKLIPSVRRHISASAPDHRRSMGSRAVQKLFSKTLQRSDAIIAISNSVAEDLKHLYPDLSTPIQVVSNPVLIDVVTSLAEGPIPFMPETYGAPLIVSAGRLVPGKDFATLIRAFAPLARDCHAHLLILGQGPERNRLEDLKVELGIDEHVHMPGFSDNPYPYIGSADVFALTTRHEGFGNVIVEALALNRTVVCTACPGGPQEILEGGKWGYLPPVGDVPAISDALLFALRNPIRAKERASWFSLDRAVDGYIEAAL